MEVVVECKIDTEVDLLGWMDFVGAVLVEDRCSWMKKIKLIYQNLVLD